MTHKHTNWHEVYLSEMTTAEGVLAKIADAIFTVWSVLLHLVLYAALMSLEGGDFHLFLDGISIEAVFVGMFVGINTKLANKRADVAQRQRDQMQDAIEGQIEYNTKLTVQVHELTEEIHKLITARKYSTS